LPDAVAIISSSGIALIVGRLLAGWIIDRIFAPYVAVFFLVCPLAGLLVLRSSLPLFRLWLVFLLLGLGIGGETDLLSYMFFPAIWLAKFGTIYGWISPRRCRNAVGSSIMGWAFQLTHSYSATLVAYSLLLAVATGLPWSWALTAIHPPIVTTCPLSLHCEQKTYETHVEDKIEHAGNASLGREPARSPNSAERNTSLRFRGSSGK